MDDAEPTVAVVIPCFAQARFLGGAIESVAAQSRAADEVIVVDDGGDEDLQDIVGNYSGVKLLQQDNRGLASARNLGLREAAADTIVFLDADDRLLPGAVEAGLRCSCEHPEAVFIYGAHEELREGARKECFTPAAARSDLVRFNCVGMIGAAMFDRSALLSIGGFDESLGMCEDWDAFLRLSRSGSFAVHDEPVAVYVKHAGNMSNDVRALRHWIGMVRDRERARGLTADEQRSWRAGAAAWDAAYPEFTPAHLARRLVRKAARGLSLGARRHGDRISAVQ